MVLGFGASTSFSEVIHWLFTRSAGIAVFDLEPNLPCVVTEHSATTVVVHECHPMNDATRRYTVSCHCYVALDEIQEIDMQILRSSSC